VNHSLIIDSYVEESALFCTPEPKPKSKKRNNSVEDVSPKRSVAVSKKLFRSRRNSACKIGKDDMTCKDQPANNTINPNIQDTNPSNYIHKLYYNKLFKDRRSDAMRYTAENTGKL